MDVAKWWTQQLSSVALMVTFTLMFAGNVANVVASEKINNGAMSTTANPAPNFNLTTHGGLISIKAQNASLKTLVEQLGKELHIVVENKLPQDELVNAEFESLSVEEALKRLSRNYAYEADEKSGAVTKIVLMPRGDATAFGKTQPSIAPEQATQILIAPAAMTQISDDSTVHHDATRNKATGGGVVTEGIPGKDKQRAEADTASFEFSFDPSAMDGGEPGG